jgi:hypothetical protein
MQGDTMSKFFNPGKKIYDRLQYTHPTKDPREGNTLSYYLMDAPEGEFFEVPDSLTLDTAEGEVVIAVNFAKRVKALYQNRGVIQIFAHGKEIAEEDNAATNEDDAKAKGNAMWREYLRTIAREHFTSVEETKSFGGVPRPATGLTKYALNTLNFEDPADRIDSITRAKEGTATNKEMQAKIDELAATVNKLLGARGDKGATPSRT